MPKRKKISGLIGADNTGPILLLFSPRERMREILTAGLVQCDYQILQAGSSYLAGIKASQMLPTLVIADLSCENPKDVLMIPYPFTFADLLSKIKEVVAETDHHPTANVSKGGPHRGPSASWRNGCSICR